MPDFPIIVDDSLPIPMEVRSRALAAGFRDWCGPDGEIYKRVRLVDVPELRLLVEHVMGGPVEMHGMGFRLNYAGERPNAAIHSDLGWGTHAAVVYLTPEGEGGTAFWRHRATGSERIEVGDVELFDQVRHDWNSVDAWEQVRLVPWKFNRCVIYPGALFHSRWPFEAFGDDASDGRLIAIAFFTPMQAMRAAA